VNYESGFISEGHVQKLDLLAHLIANLHNTLILQGAVGIGKSALLAKVHTKVASSSNTFLLQSTINISFESIQNSLLKLANDKSLQDGKSLADNLEEYAQQDQLIILLIDDAAALVCGLLGTLVDYAAKYPALRLVLSLTHEEYLKIREVERIQHDCHIIELTELNSRECAALALHMVKHNETRYRIDDIDNAFIDNVYQQTRGNIGDVVKLLKGGANNEPVFNNKLIAVIVITVFFISVVVNVVFFKEETETKPRSAVLEVKNKIISQQKKEIAVTGIAIVEAAAVSSKGLDDSEFSAELNEEQKLTDIKEVDISASETQEITKKVATQIIESHKVGLITPNQVKGVTSPKVKGGDDRQWLFSQNDRDYTLQLMVLSEKKQLIKAQKEYKKHGLNVSYIVKKTKNKNKFILFYGVFSSLNDAKNKIKEAPANFKGVWPRKFLALKKEL